MEGKKQQTFEFFGRVFPDARPLSIDYIPRHELHSRSDDFPDCSMSIEVREGLFTVRINVTEYSYDIALVLHQHAWDAVQSLVNSVGFIKAIPYFVMIDGIRTPDGEQRHLVLGDPELRSLHSFTEADIEKFSDLLIEDFAFGQALSDLMSALSRPHYAPISYGRVADSLARLVSPSKSGAEMWKALRETLLVDREFLDSLTDVSKGPRHGDRTPVSGEDNRLLSIRAWKLMERYFHYRLAKSPLDPDRFPLLKADTIPSK